MIHRAPLTPGLDRLIAQTEEEIRQCRLALGRMDTFGSVSRSVIQGHLKRLEHRLERCRKEKVEVLEQIQAEIAKEANFDPKEHPPWKG